MAKNGTKIVVAGLVAYLVYTMLKAKIILAYTLAAYGAPPAGKVLANEGWQVSIECQWAETTTYQAQFIFQGAQMSYSRFSPAVSLEKGQKASLMADFTPVTLELPGPLVVGVYDMTIDIFSTSRPTETLDTLKVAAALTVV